MDVDPSWSFAQYHAYEQDRFKQSLAEHESAEVAGLTPDPKSRPHGGYRIACVWPEEVTESACALSARLAELLPGTPAYPRDAIHSSIGNIAASGGRVVDPQRLPEDRILLDRLARAVEVALQGRESRADTNMCGVTFAPALLAPRMALVFGRPEPAYWALHRAIHAACAADGIELVTSWGPHLTLTRFSQVAGPAEVAPVAEALRGWRPITAAPTSVLVGYYTVAPKGFRVDPHRLLELK